LRNVVHRVLASDLIELLEHEVELVSVHFLFLVLEVVGVVGLEALLLLVMVKVGVEIGLRLFLEGLGPVVVFVDRLSGHLCNLLEIGVSVPVLEVMDIEDVFLVLLEVALVDDQVSLFFDQGQRLNELHVLVLDGGVKFWLQVFELSSVDLLLEHTLDMLIDLSENSLDLLPF